ncbi:uncharacterized protein LOC112249530 [Oncorhynchus tshawytscha]|uniref:uncharacterized protein LOC112249530 n=1 Tax=Oncorhynchus tshawytscha TaxID=74940 RepID=UPI000D0A0D58|nr:uncharacterized protein LOC112249530 [Oncorhynchus tshawytscha]
MELYQKESVRWMRRHSQSLLQDLFYMGVQAGDRDTPIPAQSGTANKTVAASIISGKSKLLLLESPDSVEIYSLNKPVAHPGVGGTGHVYLPAITAKASSLASVRGSLSASCPYLYSERRGSFSSIGSQRTAVYNKNKQSNLKALKEAKRSNVTVTMTYLGSLGHLGSAGSQQDELKVLQQICGGENICVFKGLVQPGEQFQWVSQRHRGYPFSGTMYVNSLIAARISSCCEYRYALGFQQGKKSCFRLTWLAGGMPCYRCTSFRNKYSSYQQLNNGTQENLSLPPDENPGNAKPETKPKKAVKRRTRKNLKDGSTGSWSTDTEDPACTNVKKNVKARKPKTRKSQSHQTKDIKDTANEREDSKAPANHRDDSMALVNEREDSKGSGFTGECEDLSLSGPESRTHQKKTRQVKKTPEKDKDNAKTPQKESNNRVNIPDSLQDEEALSKQNGKKNKDLGSNGKSRNGERLKDFYEECMEMSTGLDLSPNKQHWFKANILERRRLEKKLSSCPNPSGSDVELSEESDSALHPDRHPGYQDRAVLNTSKTHISMIEQDLQAQLDVMMQVLNTSDEVEQLVLRNTGLTDALLLSLAAALKRSASEVTFLNLNLNHLGPQGAHILLDLLGAKPQVKGLLLFGNQLGDPGVLTLLSGLAQLQEITTRHPTSLPWIEDPQVQGQNPLTHSGVPLPPTTRGTLYPFSLLELDIGGNGLSSNGLRMLTSYMRLHSRLQYLGLARTTGADLEAWRELFDSLKGNVTLSHIILDESNLGDQGARLFADTLRANQSLRQVDLDSNGIGEVGGSEIIEALLCRTQFPLRHLSLEGNGISTGLMGRIQQEVRFN